MGSGGVAIAALPTVICLKVPFSDGLGGGNYNYLKICTKASIDNNAKASINFASGFSITFATKKDVPNMADSVRA